jgi:argininosuccinate lyase
VSKKAIKSTSKLWGGAHASSDSDALLFASSSDVYGKPIPENTLIPFDIATNQAHIAMLHEVNLLSSSEFTTLKDALSTLLQEYEAGTFEFDPNFEDIHSQIEAVLTDKIGDAAKKMHTARSRNDQVTTDMYLYLHAELNDFSLAVSELAKSVKKIADTHLQTLCPGYTHHQKATVTSFGDILNAYVVMFERDIVRLKQVKELYDYSPLGATTGYESLLPVDSEFTAKQLGFSKPFTSSIDVIGTRGEFEAAVAQAVSHFMTHISMLAQTLITFSSQAYGFITIADDYTTGSSVMPQKKNPDLLEIMKAKNVYAHSVESGLSSLLQSAFVGYNRDSQYSKMMIMQLFEEVRSVPMFLTKIVHTMVVNKDVMLAAASGDFITSTGFMELLVAEKKIALRDAKRLIEKAVSFSANKDKIDRNAFDKASEATGIDAEIDDEQLSLWQSAEYQLAVRRNRSGV